MAWPVAANVTTKPMRTIRECRIATSASQSRDSGMG
jgi:hypothetical protein